jgi:uncharacterized RDD family membrane protein YckC
VTRFLARLLDGAIIGGISAVLIVPIYLFAFVTVLSSAAAATTEGQTAVTGTDTASQSTAIGTFFLLWVAVFVISVALQYGYYVEFALRRGGQTIGKRVMKIGVVPINTAESLTRGHLGLRWISEIGMGFVPGLGLIDVLFPLWDKPYTQALHDKAAKTVVVRLSP